MFLVLNKNKKISDAIKALNITGSKTLIVVNNKKKKKLLGTISDGDIRKNLIKKNINLDTPLSQIINKNPFKFFSKSFNFEIAKNKFLSNSYDLIPIVDDNNHVIKVIDWDFIYNFKEKSNNDYLDSSIIIMAGGQGLRMKPFTDILPKPLLPINGKPIIEIIINNFLKYKPNNIFVSINFKAEYIKLSLENFIKNKQIKFIKEHKPLGTIGAIKKINHQKIKNIIIANCDSIYNFDVAKIYDNHIQNKSKFTVVLSPSFYKHSYGNCLIDLDGSIKAIEEKPEINFLNLIGFYIIDKSLIKFIPKDKVYHATDLIEVCLKKKIKVNTYTLDKNEWFDIGQWSELNNYLKYND